MDKEKEIFIV